MKRKTLLTILVFVAFVCALSACSDNPAGSIVTSKNDGSFDASILRPADSDNNTGEKSVVYCDSFSSLDGSVSFAFDVHSEIANGHLPVVEVAPHPLTVEDAQRIAEVLFPEGVFYEDDPERQLSSHEIQENISYWSKYLDREMISDLYGSNSEEFIQSIQEIVHRYLDYNLKLMESAPDNDNKLLCTWSFTPEKYAEKGTNTLSAIADTGIAEYKFIVSSRDEDDYKINNIFAYLNEDNSPNSMSAMVKRYELCKSAAPTDEEINNAVETVQRMLDNMGIGEWQVDEWGYSPLGRGTQEAYVIHVNAVPVFEGVQAIRQPQLDNLKSTEVYASNYYYTDASFELSPGGVLLSCTISSPVDVIDVVNCQVQTLSTENLLEKAKSHLSLFDYHNFSPELGEYTFLCKVTINELDYGLTRVKVPNTDASYYYVPALTLRGRFQSYEEQSGEIWIDSLEKDGSSQTLLVLNAVDGSIIYTTNGY